MAGVYSQLSTINKLHEAERKQQAELNKQVAEEQRLKEERENANFFERLGVTVADIFTELGGGLAKLVEGVADAALTLTNIPVIGSGWLIEKIVGNDNLLEDAIKFDATQEWWYSWEDDITKKSYLNDNGVGNTTKEIIRGVGQQLPTIAAIALAPVTGGASLSALPYTLGATIASAGGTGVEEALNEDADFGQAFLYGTLQAGIEGLVEFASAGMGKGITSIGKAMGKTATKTMGKVMLEEALSEAFEEGVGALVNPLTKRIYDEDALEAYKDMSFYQNAAEQALVGGIVGGITAGTGAIVRTNMAGGKANLNINESINEIEVLDRKEANLWKNGKLDTNAIENIDQQRKAEIENISKQLKSMNDADRKAVIEKYNLQKYVNENGDIKTQINQNNKTNNLNNANSQNTAQSTNLEQSAENMKNVARKPLISDNIEAYSPSLRNTELVFAPTSNNLSEAAKSAKKFITSLDPNAKLVITDNMFENVNAFYDTKNKILYLSNNATTQEIAGHEFTHSLEGTKEYSSLANYILENTENVDQKIQEKIKQYQEVNKEAKSGEAGKEVALYEAQTEIVAEEMGKLLSDPKAIDRVINQNKSVANRIWQWIKDVVAKLTKRGGDKSYYEYIRNAEKLYAEAIKKSVGGIGLSEVAAIAEFEKQAKEAEALANKLEKRYNVKTNTKDGVKISKQEYAILSQAIMAKNANSKTLKPIDFANTSNKFYVYENQDIGNFKVILEADIEADREIIKAIKEELKNETYGRAKDVDTMAKIVKDRRASNSRDSSISGKGRASQSDVGLSAREQTSDTGTSIETAGKNNRYSLDINDDLSDAEKKLNSWIDSLSYDEFMDLVGEDINLNDKVVVEEKLTKNQVREAYIEKLYSEDRLDKIVTKIVKNNPKMYDYFKDTKMNRKYDPLIPTKGDEFVVMFHGTPSSDFYAFDSSRIGKNGTQMGSGFYFTASLDYAKGYKSDDGRVISTLLNIEKPLSRSKHEITRSQLKNFIEKVVDKTGDDYLSNYGDVSSEGYENVLNNCVDQLLKYESNDADMIEEIYISSRMDFDEFHNGLTDLLGYDGIIAWNKAEGTQAIIFKSNQAKDIFNYKPTKNNDFRFALSDKTDSDGTALSEQQREFFRNSKIRVKEVNGWKNTISRDGKLFPVYHGTDSDEFFEFDKNMIGSANDMGWYGKGYYFAFSKGEAGMYGRNVLKCYLNIENPFFFTEEMQAYDGIKSGDIIFDFASFVINLADKFPALSKTLSTDYATKYNEVGESDISSITFYDLAAKIKEVYGSDRLQIIPFQNGDETQYGYIMRSNFENLDIPKELKEIIKKERLYSAWSADYALEKGKISEDQHDALYEKVYEKYDKEDLEDEFVGYHRFNSVEEAKENRLSVATDYLHRYVYRDFDMHMPETYMQQIGDDFRKALIKNGYDGVLQSATGDEVVAFYENQIKLTSNKNPTSSNDMRYSLKDGEGDYNYSKGQISKYVAEHSKMKAYTKADAEKVINTVISEHLNFGNKYGELTGKTKDEIVSKMWHALNTVNEGYRLGVALDIADYIIENAVVQDMYGDDALQSYFDYIDAVKSYLHNVDLDSLKGEIKYHYDTDNSPYAIWGKRKGTKGSSPDQIAQELEEYGVHFNSNVSADIFFEMDERYREAVKKIKAKTKEKIADIASSEEIKELRNNIAREVSLGYDNTGHKTKLAETIEKYTNQISSLKKAVRDIKQHNKAKNNAISTIERLKDEFVKNKPAGWKVPQQVVDFVKDISKVETWRNNISKTAREKLGELQRQLPNVLDETQQEIYPYREILEEIASGKGELTTQELVMLDNVLRQFAWQLRNYDKVVFEGKSQSNTDLAAQAVRESQEAKDILKNGNNIFIKFKNKVYTNPYDRLAAFGLYRKDSIAMKMYQDMLEGDRRRANFVKDAAELFDPFFDKNKKYLSELQKDITLGDGENKVTMTKRQALALYATSLREQGRSHIFNVSSDEGVIRLLDNKFSTQGKMQDAFAKGRDVRITAEMIEEIKNKLTDADKEYLELTKKFFNEKSKDAKKVTDQQLYGITNIENGYYFPLRVSNDKIYTEAGQNNNKATQYILDLGINKSTKPNASNKIVIDGIDNIIANHIRTMSMYYGYAIPLTAYNRIMNKQVLATEGVDTTSNMRSEIQKIDTDFEGYMNKLWQDVQGISRGDKGFVSNVLSKIRWAGANAALGANPKVLVTQTLSLSAGMAEFNPKYIAKGMAHFFGEAEKVEMAKYSSLMWERNVAGISTDVSEIRQIGKEIGNKFGKAAAKATQVLNDFTTKPISWMDSNVIQTLWFAAQYEVADTMGKGYEFGTEANKVEAGKRLDEVVFRTQQTSDPLGRSEWMRSQKEIVKFARMFTGDAVQLTGRLINSINQYNIAKRMIKSSNTSISEQGKTLLKTAKTNAWKAGAAFATNQLFLLAIAMAFKWIKGKNDDEEWDDIAKNEAIANMVGLIPFGGDIYEKLQGYEPTNMAYTALSDTVEIAENLYSGLSTLITNDYQDPVKRNAAIRKTALSMSKLFGVPTQNIESYMKGIIGKISPSTREEYEALFKTKSNKAYLEKIKQATANGDEKLANTIVNIMFNSKTGKIKDDKVLEITRDLIEDGYDVLPKSVGNSITYDNETYKLTGRQHDKFMKIYSQSTDKIKTMINSYSFKLLSNEAKAKAMKFVYDYYYDLAIEDLLGEDLEEKNLLFTEAIPIEQLAMAVCQSRLYAANTDRKGNIINGSKKAKVQAFIQGLRLSAVQKYMIMGYLGYTNKYGERQVKGYINGLNLTRAQKNKLFSWSGYSA